jgi:maleate isomerase
VPDTLGFRKRIGIVVPSTNTTVQPECEPLRPRGVTNHTGRVTIKERPLTSEQAFFEHMHDMREGIVTAIDQIMTAGLDHLIVGIALETFWGGVAAADKLQSELSARAGVGVSMGSTASVAALNAFGAKRIAVLTPHQPRGDEMVRLYLQEAGFEVVRLKGLKCATPRAIAQVPAEDIRNAGGDRRHQGRALARQAGAGDQYRHLLGRVAPLRHRGPRIRPRPRAGGVLARSLLTGRVNHATPAANSVTSPLVFSDSCFPGMEVDS